MTGEKTHSMNSPINRRSIPGLSWLITWLKHSSFAYGGKTSRTRIVQFGRRIVPRQVAERPNPHRQREKCVSSLRGGRQGRPSRRCSRCPHSLVVCHQVYRGTALHSLTCSPISGTCVGPSRRDSIWISSITAEKAAKTRGGGCPRTRDSPKAKGRLRQRWSHHAPQRRWRQWLCLDQSHISQEWPSGRRLRSFCREDRERRVARHLAEQESRPGREFAARGGLPLASKPSRPGS